MSISVITVPVLLDTTKDPSHMFSQWACTYHYGLRIFPTMAVATFLLYCYTAITKRAAGRRWRVFAVAGATTLSIVPFTLILMAPTNNTLFRLEKESKVASAASLAEAQELVIKWSWLHVVRSLFPLVGAILGTMGT